MPDLHAKAAGPDAEDCLSIVSGCAGALGPGVKGDRCLYILMAEELSHDLVLARVAVEKNLGYSMTEPMRRHVEARVVMDQFFDLAAERAVSFVTVRCLTGEK